jgi:hypothetical protein
MWGSELKNKVILLLALLLLSAACTIQHSFVASRGESELLGMSKQNLLACAGAPARTAIFEGIEVFTYTGGEDTVGYAPTSTGGRDSTSGTYASGTASGNANNTSQPDTGGKSAHRYCEVIFVLKNDVVDSVNYIGPTGGLLTKGEQCAVVVKNCLDQGH